MLLEESLRSPIGRENAIIANVKFILIHADLHGYTNREILMYQGVKNSFANGIFRKRIMFNAGDIIV